MMAIQLLSIQQRDHCLQSIFPYAGIHCYFISQAGIHCFNWVVHDDTTDLEVTTFQHF